MEPEIMAEDSQTDGPYVVAYDRETTAPHFCVHPKADPFVPGTLDTGHETPSSSLSTAGKAPHALQD